MADPKDEHTSPENPDNRIELNRLAADAENARQILANKPENVVGVTPARSVMRRRVGKKVIEVQSTGHSWDGIEEYDNPLPRWWLWTFYVTVVFAIGYAIAYPAIPLAERATKGILGTTTRDLVAAEIKHFDDANADMRERLTQGTIDEVAARPDELRFAQNAGAAVFRTWCAQCHGSGAAGASGFPNLRDDDWLWGGSLDDIYTTVRHGIRAANDPDTRYSEMPKFGTDGLLSNEQIEQVADYVLSLSDQPGLNAANVTEGEQIFADNCASCHGEDGKGDRAQGAPNLTDAVWLYGVDGRVDRDIVRREIHDGPFGVMPSWSMHGLSDSDMRAVAIYVHGLGGGEAAAQP